MLYAFVGYIARVIEPLIQITLQFSQLQQALVALARVNTLLDEPLAALPSGDALETAARVAHAHGFISAMPQGYDTPLGEGGARLSVGEKQRIAMARALAGKPRILLLDEATAYIDSETEDHVQQVLATARDADQIIVMNPGRIAERGRHTDLMAQPAPQPAGQLKSAARASANRQI